MFKSIKRIIIVVFVFAVLLSSYAPVLASGGIVPDGGKKEYGNYTLNDIVLIAVNVAKWILGIVGSLALLMFVWGGMTLILSGGSQEKVSQGKQTLTNAVIGLVIVFSSYLIIQFVLKIMGLSNDWTGGFIQL